MRIRSTLSAIALLFGLVGQGHAAVITYTPATNTWVYSGFLKTDVGDYTSTGLGVLGGDGGTIVGGGSHFLWNSGLTGGGAGTYNYSTYTDFYWPGGYEVTVIGATWTNTEVRDNNQGEGIFGYQHMGTTLVGTHIPDGMLLNGVFTFDNSGINATWSYEALSAVPVPAAVWLFGSALGVLGWRQRKAA